MDCDACSGNGVLFSGCNHPYDGIIGNVLQGPVQNYNNIDTAGTSVMATFQYVNVDRITFRYGAKTGSRSVNGSGVRLNSLWSKSFNLASTAIILPVNFTGFSVACNNADALLNWEATQAKELNHFVVQRSTDGVNFSNIATVITGTTTAYSYKDKNVSSASGVVYYRVVGVDRTEEARFSSIEMVRLGKNEMPSQTLSAFPNPAANHVNITLPANWQGKAVMLQVFTADGSVAKGVLSGNAGKTETLELSSLPKGVYLVKASCGNEIAQQRIIKN